MRRRYAARLRKRGRKTCNGLAVRGATLRTSRDCASLRRAMTRKTATNVIVAGRVKTKRKNQWTSKSRDATAEIIAHQVLSLLFSKNTFFRIEIAQMWVRFRSKFFACRFIIATRFYFLIIFRQIFVTYTFFVILTSTFFSFRPIEIQDVSAWGFVQFDLTSKCSLISHDVLSVLVTTN